EIPKGFPNDARSDSHFVRRCQRQFLMASFRRYISPFCFSISGSRLSSVARYVPRRAASWQEEDSSRSRVLLRRAGSSLICAQWKSRARESRAIPNRREAHRTRSSGQERDRSARIQVPIRGEGATVWLHRPGSLLV